MKDDGTPEKTGYYLITTEDGKETVIWFNERTHHIFKDNQEIGFGNVVALHVDEEEQLVIKWTEIK